MSEQKSLSKEQQRALARLAIKRAVAQISDLLFDEAEKPAKKLHDAFLREQEKGTTQVRNLENVAYSTDRLSDIYDFLKKQIGRRQQWRYQGVGEELLDTLTGLRKRARAIVKEIPQEYSQGVDEDTERQVHLMLCREYLKHVAAHFIYKGVVK